MDCSIHSDGDYGPLRKVVIQTEDRQNSVDPSRDALLLPFKASPQTTMFISSAFSVASLTSVPRVLPQPLRALTFRRSIQAKLSIAAMASADVKLDRSTPDDQWKQVLSTEEVNTPSGTVHRGLLLINSTYGTFCDELMQRLYS